jgi:tRNA(Ile2) C34 agmatinyltransferase TiaS
MEYSIFLCRKCGAICASREGAATFSCTSCGKRNSAEKSLSLARGIESKAIPSLIAKLKMDYAKKQLKKHQ